MEIIFIENFNKIKFNSICNFNKGYIRNFLNDKILILNKFLFKNLILVRKIINKIYYKNLYYTYYFYYKYNNFIFVKKNLNSYVLIHICVNYIFKKKIKFKKKNIFIKKYNNYFNIKLKIINNFININLLYLNN